MKIYIGTDHNGFELKNKLRDYLTKHGYDVVDGGNEKLDPNDDFPVFAAKVVNDMLASSDQDAKGILICGSGQGMCMAANRFKGIRAGLAWDKESAKAGRNDDDSNILCLPSRMIDTETAKSIVQTWLDTPFAGAPRFSRRIKEMDDLS